MENKEQIAKRTKDIYIKQHKNYADDVVFERFYNMVSDPHYYHLTLEDFKGKKVLDAGCGNSAYLEVALLDFGVESLTCLDLGEDWIPELKSALIKRGADISKVNFVPGSTDNLPFPDGTFDIVFSNGVLMHLVDEEQIEKSFVELSRVTKPGGYFYSVGSNPGGLMEAKIFPAIREYYNENAEFKDFIDNLSVQDVNEAVNQFNAIQAKNSLNTINPDTVKQLFDIDYLTFLQNVIQVPKRHIFYMTEEWTRKRYLENGFEEPKRCKRFVVRKNIRQFMAPFHFDTSTKLARVLFGNGNLEFISKKIK